MRLNVEKLTDKLGGTAFIIFEHGQFSKPLGILYEAEMKDFIEKCKIAMSKK